MFLTKKVIFEANGISHAAFSRKLHHFDVIVLETTECWYFPNVGAKLSGFRMRKTPLRVFVVRSHRSSLRDENKKWTKLDLKTGLELRSSSQFPFEYLNWPALPIEAVARFSGDQGLGHRLWNLKTLKAR